MDPEIVKVAWHGASTVYGSGKGCLLSGRAEYPSPLVMYTHGNDRCRVDRRREQMRDKRTWRHQVRGPRGEA